MDAEVATRRSGTGQEELPTGSVLVDSPTNDVPDGGMKLPLVDEHRPFLREN